VSTCPNCGAAGAEVVYRVRGIPSHSCLLMETREEALAFPLGDLDLAYCPACHFSFNPLFDVAKNAYSTRYEEVQTFSPTFRAFQSALVEHLVEKRGMRGVDVVEIGCGKGEFLLELCERGGNRGVGIDPSFVPGRRESVAGDRVRFVNELYSAERHGDIPAELVVCRHTLEHIQPTGDFVRTVRRCLGDRTDSLVFFELPDQERVYRECAFWDVYYEHCSYFTQGSLERVFLGAGFEVLDSWKGFGDQYLLIEAKPLPAGQAPQWRVGEEDAAIRALVDHYAEQTPKILDGWRERFERTHASGGRTVIWGAGSKGVAFLTTLGVGPYVHAAVDINPHKHGFFMPGTGHEVIAPEALVDVRPDLVVAMNEIYLDEIREQLRAMGLEPELIAA
jgi:SAM-dependent methyltransferase